MQHKSSAKKSLCQDQPETPEQKEIRLLKNRLKREKKLSDYRFDKMIEFNASAEKYKKEAAEWKAICTTRQISATINDFYQREYYRANNELEAIKSGAKESQDIKELKERLEDAERSAATWRRLYQDYYDRYEAMKDKARGIHFTDSIPEPPAKKKSILTKSERANKINLICIGSEDGDLLDLHSRYTSPGVMRGDNGEEYFIINELNGEWRRADLFHISGEIKLGKTYSEPFLLAYERQQRLKAKQSNS